MLNSHSYNKNAPLPEIGTVILKRNVIIHYSIAHTLNNFISLTSNTAT